MWSPLCELDMAPDEDAERLLQQGESALAPLFDKHRGRLLRMVELRLDSHFRSRVDPEDVLQEAYLDVQKRLHHYVREPKTSLYIWLRAIVQQTLIEFHRRHVGAQKRNARRDLSLGNLGMASSTFALSHFLLADSSTPSQAAVRHEMQDQLESALDRMNPVDREVLVLRHFEDLSNNEIAEILQISQTAASNRYVRALGRLKVILEAISSFRTP